MIIGPGIDAFGWSGLMSRHKNHPADSWQIGVREVMMAVDGLFIPSKETGSGYDGWEDVVRAILRDGTMDVFFCGHSNGNVATTRAAESLKSHGVRCTLLCLDRTRKSCRPLGSNVVSAMDIWAGPPMKRLVMGPDFGDPSKLIKKDFISESHIGMQQDEKVLAIATKFAAEWRASVS